MLSGKSVNHNILFVCLETQRIFTVQLMFVTQLYDYDEKNSWLCLAVLKCVRFLYNCLDKNRFWTVDDLRQSADTAAPSFAKMSQL